MARPGPLASSEGYPECALVMGDTADDADVRAGGGISHVADAETTPTGG